MKKPVYILDAYGLIYRSYFAFISKPLTNQQGKNVSAIFGFFRNLHSLLVQYTPEIFIAAFDSKTPTFRHEMYSEYKATRQKTPQDLYDQIPVIEEVLLALGIPIVRQDGFEADDIIATIARRCKDEDRQCVVISGDKDLMQLVGGSVTILKPGKTGGWDSVDSEGVKAEWGVGPELMLDLLSLTGDSSDNVPGIKGIGEKTALKLLAEFGTLDGIFERSGELKGAMATKISEGREMAYFSRKLIELCYDVPSEKNLDDYSSSQLDKIAAARILEREGLPRVAQLFSPLSGAAGKDTITAAKATTSQAVSHAPPLSDATESVGLTRNEGNYRLGSSVSELSAYITQALAKGVVAFDTETTGLDVFTDQLVGFSLSHSEGEGIYFPVRGPVPELGQDAPALFAIQAVQKELVRLFSAPELVLVTHNGKFDYQILFRAGFFDSLPGKRPSCKLYDTMIAYWLIDPDWGPLSLEALAASQLSLETIAYQDTVPKGKTFADVELAQAAQYASEDADLTLRLYARSLPKLKEDNLDTLFFGMEMPLIPILAHMELAGIRLEKGALASFSKELSTDIEQTEKDIFGIVGHEFNIASPKQLQEVLFTERKLPTGKKTKTGYSTDNSVLEDLASEDILPGKILDFRALSKLKSTYVDALPALADANGRVHTSFVQTGTATGRLSSRDPNLQNIPIRDKNGRRIRQAFRAAEGYTLISADYAQIELVILAHLSGDRNLVEAFTSGVDVHKRTASLIFQVKPEDVTGDMRRIAKTINFGVMYGMSAFRLANELRIPRGQAASFINMYFETYSGVSRFIAETKEKAAETGYVTTLMGRKRRIRGIRSENKLELSGAQRVAVNTPIQGSAADIVKTAMIRIDERLRETNSRARLLLQVHDELIIEAPIDSAQATAELVKTEMEGVISLAVPLRVSVETGVNWGDFHE